MTILKKIETEGHELNLVRALFKAYAEELNEDLCFQSFEEELKDPLKKYGPPGGCVLIAYINEEPAGCIAFTSIVTGEQCEMKRLYVKPDYRKHGVGYELIKALLEHAVLSGYSKMVLDTLKRLQGAISLYQRYGFEHIPAYYTNPLPDVIYMEKVLDGYKT